MTIGKQFKVARIVNNWTLLDLSIMTLRRISQSKISLFERGLTELTDEEMKTLERALGISARKQKESWEFIEFREVTTKNDTGLVYFFKRKKAEGDWKLDYGGLQPLDLAKVKTVSIIEAKSIRISEEKEMTELIDEQLEKIKLKGRKRASAGSSYDYLSGLDDLLYYDR